MMDTKKKSAVSETGTRHNNSNRLKRDGYQNKTFTGTMLSEEDVKVIDGMQKRMDMAFCKFVIEKDWKPRRIVDEFAPYISGESAVSKILTGKQRVNIETILVMSLRFGQPLDEILLGRKQNGYTLTSDDISYLSKLVKKAERCSVSKA